MLDLSATGKSGDPSKSWLWWSRLSQHILERLVLTLFSPTFSTPQTQTNPQTEDQTKPK